MLDHPAPAVLSSGCTRRSILVRAIQGVHAAIGVTLACILGRAVLAPSLAERRRTWLSAASLAAVPVGQPLAVTLRIARPDGASEVVDRRVVYLVRTAESIRALDSTCTHLGCRTRFNPGTRLIECPCHGGVYDLQGQVVSGPPPRPLDELPVVVEDARVLVEV